MDYAEEVRNVPLVERFTFYKYLKLKRKPLKVETSQETKPETDAETNTDTPDWCANVKS